MSIFAYTDETFGQWSTNTATMLNEGVTECSKSITNLADTLVGSGWKGYAASQNYRNIVEVQNALINFTNKFGAIFEEQMKKVGSDMNALTESNLGGSGVTGVRVNVSFNIIQNAEDLADNIAKETEYYDTGAIATAITEINTVKTKAEELKQNLITEFEKLDSGAKIFDGTRAAGTKEALKEGLNVNMEEFFKALDLCSTNLKTAAENAQRILGN